MWQQDQSCCCCWGLVGVLCDAVIVIVSERRQKGKVVRLSDAS